MRAGWPGKNKSEEGPAQLFTRHLREALSAPGCPICRLVRESEEKWLWTLLYEFTGDPEVHGKFVASLGLCAAHAHLMKLVVEGRRLMTPSGVARLYESTVRSLLARLAGYPGRGKPRPDECPLCKYAQETAEREAYFLASLLREEGWRKAFEGSDGLCWPHFSLTLSQAHPELRKWLVDEYRRRLSGLLHRLSELQRKQRYDVSEPISREEADSWREALWRLGGTVFEGLLVKDF